MRHDGKVPDGVEASMYHPQMGDAADNQVLLGCLPSSFERGLGWCAVVGDSFSDVKPWVPS